MAAYFLDLVIVAVLIIGITATNGVITNTIGEKWIGRKKSKEFVQQSGKTQTSWNAVGGRGIHKKHTY